MRFTPPSPSPSDRRTLGLGAAAMLLILLVGRGVPAWRRLAQADADRLREVRLEVERVRLAVGERNRLTDSASARTRRAASVDSLILAAASPQEASAVLLAVITGMCEDAGVRLRATQLSGPHSLRGRYVVHGARVTLSGDVEALARLLAAIEDRELLMVTRAITISQPDPAARDEQPESLQAELEVETLVRSPSPDEGAERGGGDR